MPTIDFSGNSKIVDVMTAGAAISDGDLVHLSGPRELQPAPQAQAQACIGAANEAASGGENVEVVLFGKKNLVADGALSAGEPVIPSSTTDGRAVSEATQTTNHSHTALETDGTDAAPGAHQGVLAGDGSGTAEVIGVDTSGQAGESIATSTNSSDPQNARAVAVATTGTTGAGQEFEALIALKSG